MHCKSGFEVKGKIVKLLDVCEGKVDCDAHLECNYGLKVEPLYDPVPRTPSLLYP
jgi:hypothetical protein